jgi:hypothetical protein
MKTFIAKSNSGDIDFSHAGVLSSSAGVIGDYHTA